MLATSATTTASKGNPEYERHPSPEYSEALRKADREFMEKEALTERILEEAQEGPRTA
jgi:hypothetical protein